MTRKKKQREDKLPRRKLFFDRPYGVKLEELLDIYMEVIGNIDAELDMKIDKISITLSANKSEIDKKVLKLQTLQGQLMKATNGGERSFYEYEQGLFQHIFKSQIQTKFLSQILSVHNYHSELTEDKTIITDAPLNELRRLQALGFTLIQQSPQNQNKDIQRFTTLVSMKTGKSQGEILELCTANGLLFEKDDKLRFSDDKDKILNQIMEIAEDLSLSSDIAEDILSDDDTDIPGFGFDGGKIVFINSSNDRERSTYEDLEKEEIKDIDSHESNGN
ncbi:MAG: DUF2067 family protein [Candidatus Kariarchaeaceae archaeon]|jgi:hypothetical protein